MAVITLVFKVNATSPDVINDIAKSVTGAVTNANKANVGMLSPSADVAQCNFDLTVAPGWTIHDSVSRTNGVVVKAPYNGVAAEKFAEIFMYGTSGIQMAIYETFSSGTHTGTYKDGSTESNYPQRINLTPGFTVMVYASPRYLIIVGSNATGVGDTSYSGATMVAEMTRDQPWCDSTWPSFALVKLGECFGASTDAIFVPRSRSVSGLLQTGASAKAFISSIGAVYNNMNSSSYYPVGASAKIKNLAGEFVVPAFPFYATNPVKYSAPLGCFSGSSGSDIYLAPYNCLANFEVVAGTSYNYVAVPAYGTTNHILVPNR